MNYVAAALGIALALALGGVWIMDGKLTRANGTINELREAVGKETQSRKGFQAAAVECSASVDDLRAAADRREAEHARERKAMEAKRIQAEREADVILARGRQAGLDECQAMRKELDDEIDRRASGR